MVLSGDRLAQKERALCAENDVKGYPTLKYWHTDPAAGDAPGGGASKYSVRTPLAQPPRTQSPTEQQ